MPHRPYSLRPEHYPHARSVDQTDTYFGTTVEDPYRRLEDADDPEVLAWTEEQHDLARSVLDNLPGRDDYARKLTQVWNYPRMDQPVQRGDHLFFTRNDGLEPQPVLYVRDRSANASDDATAERVLLDPNTLSEDGTVSLMEWEPSNDGASLAYSLSESGEDWRTVHVRDVPTGRDRNDRLDHIKFSSLAWDAAGAGFFTSRFPADAADAGASNREQSHQLFYHRSGTAQADDIFVYAHPTLTGVILRPEVTDDGHYLVITIAGDSFIYNRLFYARLGEQADALSAGAALDIRPLFDELDASYECVGTLGEELVILTSRDAPRRRIVTVHPERPSELTTIVPETDDVIEHAVIAGEQLVVTRMHDAHNVVERYDLAGSFLGEIELPGIGSTMGAGARAHASHTSIYITYSSFLSPPSVLRHDLASGETEEFFAPAIPGFDADEYTTEQIFATSADGTRVPVFVTMRKGTALDGSHPAILYGYGGFDISLKPAYPNWLPVWLENGGIYAVAVLRGGGEYGDEWHLAGMFEKKQNVFDDFAAAAAELAGKGYTSPARLALEGGSNGGLLVAATMLQHPECCGAVLCHVPVTDMLRFQHFTAGRYWTSEYGDAEKSEREFRALSAYSPLHNVRDGRRHPPILIMSADHDDRVVPMHSKKFAARLQQADPGTNVVLLRIETKAGHGAGKPTTKQIELRADALAFLDATIGTQADDYSGST